MRNDMIGNVDGSFTVNIRRKAVQYPVWIEEGIIARWPGGIKEGIKQSGKIGIVTQENIWDLYGTAVESQIPGAVRYFVGRGERHKNWNNAGRLLDQLSGDGFDRDSMLIALGGGAIGDLTGFAASVFMRGIKYIGVPTTLMAMVDSSIGGKTAVNRGKGKNIIGSFWHPWAVICDPELLSSLPASERRAGWAEVVKYALIADEGLLEVLESARWTRDSWPRGADVSELIARCLAIKAGVVAEDETDAGRRLILNFGHTLGHGIEAASRYRGIRHGEAVAWGILASAEISRRRGMISDGDFERIDALLGRIGLKKFPPEAQIDEIFEQIVYDKKKTGGRLRWVLLSPLGAPVVVDDVPDDMARDAAQTVFGPAPSRKS